MRKTAPIARAEVVGFSSVNSMPSN